MPEKRIIDALLGRIKQGKLTVTYWDGEKRQYGNGSKYFDLKLNDSKLAKSFIKNLPLAFAEAYINGQLEIRGDIAQIIRLLANNQQLVGYSNFKQKYTNTSKRFHQSYIELHYDLGNDFFGRWLGETMLYTAADFNGHKDTIDQAQQRKADTILESLKLKPGQTLLDIGCGWGYLSVQAAVKHGVKVTGLTLSSKQLEYCKELACKYKVEKLVTFELVNFLNFKSSQQFDAISSIECMEAMAKRYHQPFLDKLSGLLKSDGMAVLQISTIAGPSGLTEPFLDKYIFPSLYVPAQWELFQGLSKAGLRVKQFNNLRQNYYYTTRAWLESLKQNKNWIEDNYDQRLYRIFELYLGGMVGTAKYSNLDTLRLLLMPERTALLF